MGNRAAAMRGDAPPVYVNTERAASVLGVSPATVRRRCEGGEIPGATRIGARGSAWRIPLAALIALTGATVPAARAQLAPTSVVAAAATTTPRTRLEAVRGVSADSGVPVGSDVTSTHRAPVELVDTAARVVHRLGSVTTRPASALASVMPIIAAAAVRHAPDADGRCTACRWPGYPCPDAELLSTVVHRVADVVLEGGE